MKACAALDVIGRRALMRAELARESSRRSLPAAQTTRLTADWRTLSISLDTLLNGGGLDTLRTRARELRDGDPYFSAYLRMLKTNVAGNEGMTLKNKASDPPMMKGGKLVPGALDVLANTIVETRWWDWCQPKNCTTSKDMSFVDVQHLAIGTWGTDGETLWRHVIGDEAQNEFGYAIQPIASDRIDTTLNRNPEGGGKIRMGVEKNAAGRVVALWLYDDNPSDYVLNVRGHNSRRYTIEDFVYVRMIYEVGQTRGVPLAAVSMLRAKMLSGFEEAHLEGTRAAACKMGFITKTPDAGGAGYTGANAEGGGKYMDAEPGSLEELPMGMDIKTVDWGFPNANYNDFVKACLRGIAAGLNVSYPTLANDYGEVNFSSGRMSRLEEVETWKLLQSWFSCQFLCPIFSKWLEVSLLNGAINATLATGSKVILPAVKFAKFNQPHFHGRRWGWVDPTKEVAAKIDEINSGMTSLTRVLAEQGIDRDELFEEIREDREKLDAAGITLPNLYENALKANPADEMPEEKEEKPAKIAVES